VNAGLRLVSIFAFNIISFDRAVHITLAEKFSADIVPIYYINLWKLYQKVHAFSLQH